MKAQVLLKIELTLSPLISDTPTTPTSLELYSLLKVQKVKNNLKFVIHAESGSRRDRRHNRSRSAMYLISRRRRSNDEASSMTCQKLKQLGEKCTSSENCLSSHCLPAIFSTSELLEERILIRGDLR